jgi:hypothetical protein
LNILILQVIIVKIYDMTTTGGKESGSIGQNIWQKHVAEVYGPPMNNELRINYALDCVNNFEKNWGKDLSEWQEEDGVRAKSEIMEMLETNELFLKVACEVGEGKMVSMVINSEQAKAFEIIYGLPHKKLFGRQCFAEVETVEENPIRLDILIKFGDVLPETDNNVIISREAARLLSIDWGCNQGKEIKILGLNVNKKPLQINLDEF